MGRLSKGSRVGALAAEALAPMDFDMRAVDESGLATQVVASDDVPPSSTFRRTGPRRPGDGFA